MKLNKNSWHYKMWASTYDRGEVPYKTDLCRYCHRIFWKLVLFGFLFGALGLVVVMGSYLIFYKGLYQNTGAFFTVVGVLGVIITAVVLYVKWINGKRSYREPKTLVGKYARAAKQGICPLVEFSDSKEE